MEVLHNNMSRNSSFNGGGINNNNNNSNTNALLLQKQIDEMQKKLDALEKKDRSYESQNSYASNSNNDKNLNDYEKWIRDFSKSPAVRDEFRKTLSTDAVEWLDDFKKCMTNADSLSPDMVAFLQNNIAAFDQKRIVVKAGEKRPAVDANGKKMEHLKKVITSIMMVLNFLLHC